MKVALFGRRVYPDSIGSLYSLFLKIAKKRGCKVFVFNDYRNSLYKSARSRSIDEKVRVPLLRFLDNAQVFGSYRDLPADTDLFLSLGGDGTFLSSVALVRQRNIPVAGINFGRFGFLTTGKIYSEEAVSAGQGSNGWLDALLAGKIGTEERTLLRMECVATPPDFYPCALNEIAVQRTGPAVLELQIRIDGEPIPEYIADGVVISTATGSTAYSMSAGGPIVMPSGRVLIIVPVAPHNLNIRPLVVPDTSMVEVSFTTRYGSAVISADNRFFETKTPATIRVKKARGGIRVVTENHDFMQRLSDKLFWGADRRSLK